MAEGSEPLGRRSMSKRAAALFEAIASQDIVGAHALSALDRTLLEQACRPWCARSARSLRRRGTANRIDHASVTGSQYIADP
jgi:hypothetical protein